MIWLKTVSATIGSFYGIIFNTSNFSGSNFADLNITETTQRLTRQQNLLNAVSANSTIIFVDYSIKDKGFILLFIYLIFVVLVIKPRDFTLNYILSSFIF